MSVPDCGFEIAGGDVGVLIVHGLNSTPFEMNYVANVVARDGYTVHVPMLPGHCGSEADLRASGHADWMRCCHQALDRLRSTCSTVVIGGYCAGAVLAMKVVLDRQDEIAGLFVHSPVLWYDGPSVPAYARFLLRPLLSTPLRHHYSLPTKAPYGIKDERIRRVVEESYLSGNSSTFGTLGTPASSLHQMNELVKAVKPRLSEIKLETLIIHAREDDYASLRNPTYLQRHLGGMVETVVLDDSYHLIPIDRQKRVVADRTARFINGLADDHRRQASYRIAAE